MGDVNVLGRCERIQCCLWSAAAEPHQEMMVSGILCSSVIVLSVCGYGIHHAYPAALWL